MKKIVLFVLLALFIATYAICSEDTLTSEQEAIPLAEIEEVGTIETLAVKKSHKKHHLPKKGSKKHHKRHHAGKKGLKRHHKKHLPKKVNKKVTKKVAKQGKIAKKANKNARKAQKKAARKAKKQQTKTRIAILEQKVQALMQAERVLEKAENDLSKLVPAGAQPKGTKVSISQAVLNTLNQKVATIENSFNAQLKAANDKIVALNNQVSYANGKITSLESQLNTLRGQCNVAPIQNDLNNVKNTINSVNANLNARVANLENINNQKNVGPVSFPRGILLGNRWIISEEGTGSYEALVFRDRIRSQTRDSRYAFFKERYVDL